MLLSLSHGERALPACLSSDGPCPVPTLSSAATHTHVHVRALRVSFDAQTSIPTDACPPVQGAFKDSLFLKNCMSQYFSHLAAFFIVARAKRSIVKSLS